MPETLGAVIVAAGSGTRMGDIDKAFAPLDGRPLIARTLSAFQACAAVSRVILVLAAENLDRGRALVVEHQFTKVAAVCAGGPGRQDSVRMGLEALGECEWVAVHDGARPLVTRELIEAGLEASRETGAAVPALRLVDTIKEADAGGTVVRTLDRGRLWAAQTPQVLRYDLIVRAHQEVTAHVTDDAAMLESLGLAVKVFPGSRQNIKITTPEDLRLAEAMLAAER